MFATMYLLRHLGGVAHVPDLSGGGRAAHGGGGAAGGGRRQQEKGKRNELDGPETL